MKNKALCCVGVLSLLTLCVGMSLPAGDQEVIQVEAVGVDVITTAESSFEEISEEYEVEVITWRPERRIEKRARTIKLPVFTRERVLCEQKTVMTEAVAMPDGVVSVPRVIKETPFRTVQRNDNFYVDGFAGGNTATTSTAVQIARPFASQRKLLPQRRRGLFCRDGVCR